MVRVYIDNIIVITKYDLVDPLMALERVLQKVAEVGSNTNAKKTFPYAQKIITSVYVLLNTG